MAEIARSIDQLTEEDLARMDENMPREASEAIRQAYRRALKTRGYVLEAIDGELVKTYEDGRREVVRELSASPQKISPGTHYFSRKTK